MGIFDNESSGNFLFPPKVGNTLTVQIVGSAKRVQNPDGSIDMNYLGKGQINKGFYDIIPVLDENGEEKEMLVNVWKLYFALKDTDINEGDTIKIDHVNSGTYNITKE